MGHAKTDKPAAIWAVGAVDVNITAFQLALASFRLPVLAHAVFNALAATGMALLGHPILAAALFVAATAFDTVKQALLRRWFSASQGADEARGLRKLALLCAARACVYTVPTFLMALSGGTAELIFYGLQLATLLAVSVAAGALSRTVFWGFAAPMAVQILALATLKLDPMAAIAVLIALLILVAVVNSVASGASAAISAWHTAFVQSIADKAAADTAREAARSASRARANFLATMSHEIRTPMNGVLGMAQLLKRDEVDPAQLERLDVLIDSGEYLLSILNDILDASKIDAGKLEIVTAPEDLRAFLERVVGFWTPRAEERGVALGLSIADDTPGRLAFDALRLRQALFNLMGNALKFTEAGRVDLIAEAAAWDHDTVHLHLTVRDTGPGIAPQHLASLFDRFAQIEDPEARRVDGTGLGLSIVRQLVELMGGRVWVESEMGVGSAFHLELPLAIAEGGAAEAAVAENVALPLAMPSLRILTVDDNAVNLLVLEQLLTSLGHTVSKAESGEEALAALAGETFDLVLTDIQMPGMSGSDLLRQVRSGAGPNRSAPIIALTADVTSGGRQRYLDEGFTEHSSKPIQLQELLGAIVRAVSAEPGQAQRVA